jgi:GT2 family glycosyltransferase
MGSIVPRSLGLASMTEELSLMAASTIMIEHLLHYPTVSVIIVNWNGKNLLFPCLQSLRRQTFKDFEIIVVDNGSTDGSIELIQHHFPEVQVIALNANLGFSTANNIGIRHARGKYIALLNNDAEADPHWLEELVKALDTHREISFCASKMLLYHQPDLADACGDFYSVDGTGGKIGHLQSAVIYSEPREVFGACAGAAIYRRELLEELGGFDEDFFIAHEDTDLSFRAQLRGHRCLYVPTAIVYHKLSATIGANSPTYLYYGHRNAEFVYFKNMPRPLLWRSLPSHLMLNLALLLFYVRRGQAGPFLRAKLDAVKALPTLLQKRREIQQQRVVSVDYIAGLLQESWLRQAIRKKLVQRVHQALRAGREWGRQILPYSWKHWLKQALSQNSTSPAAQILLPSDSVEDAIRVWTMDFQLSQTLVRITRPNYCTSHTSIIMLAHNKLPLTRLCIESLYRYTDYPNFELVVVDNASEDGTRDYLEGLQRVLPNLRVIFNSRNEGFARASNIGIMRSRGDYLVLLNNDTIVTPGWLARLISYVEKDPKVGMIGPVTNSAGNEQMIRACYSSIEELERFAEQRLSAFEGRHFEIEALAMFCVVFRRRLIDEIGLLDERFGLGTFEDDDFCYRAKLRGYKLICAEDVFVHHFGRGTTRSWDDREYLKLFEHNRRLFERKWGVRWRPARLRV